MLVAWADAQVVKEVQALVEVSDSATEGEQVRVSRAEAEVAAEGSGAAEVSWRLLHFFVLAGSQPRL